MTIIQHDLMLQKASPAHARGISAVLSAGFYDDPVFRWVLPNDAHRRASLPEVFDAFVAAFAPHDETYTTRTLAGAALWAPPGVEAIRAEDLEAFESAIEEACTEDALPRMAEIMELLSSTHPHEPCWYLNLLAVEPSAQGHGIGSALLRAVTAHADATGERCYLEATSEHNRRLYERHGFVATAELRVADCPPLWAMWRDPQ